VSTSEGLLRVRSSLAPVERGSAATFVRLPGPVLIGRFAGGSTGPPMEGPYFSGSAGLSTLRGPRRRQFRDRLFVDYYRDCAGNQYVPEPFCPENTRLRFWASYFDPSRYTPFQEYCSFKVRPLFLLFGFFTSMYLRVIFKITADSSRAGWHPPACFATHSEPVPRAVEFLNCRFEPSPTPEPFPHGV